MVVVKVVVRLVVGFFAGGWLFVLVLYVLDALTAVHAWGVMHSGLALPVYVLAWAFAYWLLGYIPSLAIKPRTPVVEVATTSLTCARCSKEISFDDAVCPHGGMKFNIPSGV